jgi:hypothetical protein
MSSKHNQDWEISESRTFMNMYLNGYKWTDEKVLCTKISHELGRSFHAIKLRVQEVARILNGERTYPIVTPHMVQAVNEVLESGQYTKGRLSMIFE